MCPVGMASSIAAVLWEDVVRPWIRYMIPRVLLAGTVITVIWYTAHHPSGFLSAIGLK